MSWSSQYAVTGSVTDVTTDASDPNTSAPPGARVFRCPIPLTGGATSTPSVIACTADGTSLAIEFWFYDESVGKERWYKFAAGTATTATGAISLNMVPGALTFVRVVTNTGNVKNYMVGTR